MNLIHKEITYELNGKELAEKLGIKGTIISVSYTSTEKGDTLTSKVVIKVIE